MALTKTHLRMVAQDVVNVLDFGAVGDGVADDSAALQAAIDSGASIITSSVELYVTDTTQITLASNQTFKDIDFNSTASSVNNGYCFKGTDVSNVHFKNCKWTLVSRHRVAYFTGTCSDISFDGCQAINNDATGYSAYGILFGDASSTLSNIKVVNSTFENCCGSASVAVKETSRCVIANNSFRSTLSDPGSGSRPKYPVQVDFQDGTDGVVDGNTFEIPLSEDPAVVSDAFGYAFYQGDGEWDRLTFSNNTIRALNISGRSVGIKIGGGTSSDHIAVTGNTVSGQHYFGIRLEVADNIVVVGNTVKGSTENCIRSDYSKSAVISSNELITYPGSTGALPGGGNVIYAGIDTDLGNTGALWTVTGNFMFKDNSSGSRGCINVRGFHPKFIISGNTLDGDAAPYIYDFTNGNTVTVANQSSANVELGENTVAGETSLGQTRLIDAGTNTIQINSNSNGIFWDGSTFGPLNDDARDLGDADNRWAEVFSTTGTINTSDEREKQQIRDLNDQEKAVAIRLKSLIKAYKWNAAVESKGDSARIHVGVIAQQVKSAFEAEGLDGFDYGVLCHDEWDSSAEEIGPNGDVLIPAKISGDRYGIRYDQLFAFIISAL